MDALDKTSPGKQTNGHFYSGTIHSGNHFFLKIIDFYVFHTLLYLPPPCWSKINDRNIIESDTLH